MPFFHEFDDAYQLAIKPASEAAVLMQSAWTSRFRREYSGPGLQPDCGSGHRHGRCKRQEPKCFLGNDNRQRDISPLHLRTVAMGSIMAVPLDMSFASSIVEIATQPRSSGTIG